MPGRPVWCLTTKIPLKDDAGQPIGIVGFSRDIRTVVEPSTVPASFARALEMFDRELPSEASPAWLARLAKMPTHRFARTMKLIFGLTPTQYIAKGRIGKASHLLLETEKSVAEIAQACGYFDHSAFSRASKKPPGPAPSDSDKNGDNLPAKAMHSIASIHVSILRCANILWVHPRVSGHLR